MNTKILINTPNIKKLGGIANHYLGLKSYWTENVRYNYVGSRNGISGKYLLPFDVLKFIMRIVIFNPNVVLLNPSLVYNVMRRDMFFLRIVKLFSKKVAVFIHGWQLDYEDIFFNSNLFKTLCRAETIFVLARDFKDKLIEAGYYGNVSLATTKVDNKLIEGFEINQRTGKIENILFLARIERTKGIYETIDTYAILKKKYPLLKLIIAGDGSEFNPMKQYIQKNNIEGVSICGYVNGDKLIEILKNSDLSLFPTFYGEGMPTSVLEAMAFGLPVFTRPVGGIKDFFDENMGFVTESLDAQVFADSIEEYIKSPDKTLQTSIYNHNYAKEHFMASKVALEIEKQIQ
jgi:glycosyltransferase involved in cell wall biosynthesis